MSKPTSARMLLRAVCIEKWLVVSILVFFLSAINCSATVEPEITTAVRHNDLQRVRTLLSEGANLNETDDGAEQTPLMWAVRARNVQIVRTLLEHGARVNMRDDFGNTAMKLALQSGNAEISQMLLKHGAMVASWAGANHRAVVHKTKGISQKLVTASRTR